MTATIADASESITLTVGPAPEPLLPEPWSAIGLGIAAVTIAAALAWHHSRRRLASPASRRRRIAAAVTTFAAAATSMSLPAVLNPADYDPFDRYVPAPELVLAATFAAMALLGLLLLGTLDLLVDILRPRRSRLWLALSPPMVCGFVGGLFAAAGGGPLAPMAEQLPIVLAAALAASLSWWARLPRPGEEVASIFD